MGLINGGVGLIILLRRLRQALHTGGFTSLSEAFRFHHAQLEPCESRGAEEVSC